MKKVFVLVLVLLALAGVVAVLTGRISTRLDNLVSAGGGDGQRVTAPALPVNVAAVMSAPRRPATATNPPTITPTVCVITTDIEGGRVNLRACGSHACQVLDILDEGQRVTVLTWGDVSTTLDNRWYEVQTGADVTGYVYSKFCK